MGLSPGGRIHSPRLGDWEIPEKSPKILQEEVRSARPWAWETMQSTELHGGQ